MSPALVFVSWAATTLMAVFSATLMAVFSAVCWVRVAQALRSYLRTSNWRPTEAEVDFEIRPAGSMAGADGIESSTMYSLHVRFVYSVDGKTYSGNRLDDGPLRLFRSRQSALSKMNRLVGGSALAWYDPHRPDDAVLSRHPDIVWPLVSALALGGGAIWLGLRFWCSSITGCGSVYPIGLEE